MPTHIISRMIRLGGIEFRSDMEVTNEGAKELDLVIPASAADQLVDFTADVSQLKSLVMIVDRDMTVHTNSNSVPVNTFDLKAGHPFQWVNGDPALRDTAGAAVTTDITALHVVNPDGEAAAAGRLQIYAIYDATV